MDRKAFWPALAAVLALSSHAAVTTPPIRVHPDPAPPEDFTFTPQTYAPLNAVATSDAILFNGTAPSPISITGGTYSINGGDYTSAAGTVQVGDVITVRQTTASTLFTSTRATLSINSRFCDSGCGIQVPFDVTTTGGHQVTHLSGTAVVAGVGVTASATGVFGSASECGAAGPYYINTFSDQGFTFTRPVVAISVPIALTTPKSNVSFVPGGPSGAAYPLVPAQTSNANFTAQVGAIRCGSVLATISGTSLAAPTAPANGVVEFARRIREFHVQGGNFTYKAMIGLFIRPWAHTDLDADGQSDLLWHNADGRSAVWTMQGLSPAATQQLTDFGSAWSVVAVGDFNGDGTADLVWQNEDGRAALYNMSGTAAIRTVQFIDAGQGWTVVGAADLDGTGKSKVIAQKADGTVAALTVPDFNVPAATAILLGPGTGWSVVKIADFDGDNKDDILWKHTDGRNAIWHMNGTSVASSGEIMSAGGWSAIQAADLDGDGQLDVVYQHTDGTLAAQIIVGNSVTSSTTLIGPGSGWTVAQVGDFNGDGKDDLLFTHSDGRVAIWLMDGLTPISQAQIMNAASGWSVARVGDFDGDGKTDIVWQHTDGRVAIWLMNGTAIASSGEILGAGTGWSVNTAVAR